MREVEAVRPFTIERPQRGRGVRLIAMTPLIDMVFILLIFFMLASSFIEWRALGLETAGAGEGSKPVVLAIGPDGGLVLSGRAVAPDGLRAALRGLDGGGVVVVPHPDLPLAQVVPVLDAAEAAGAGPLTLSSGGDE